ncbi:MAG: TolC family protein [Candidatus Aminicenantes bacterium]|nr:MAG: TolC family protein [Candidatus Aminicenantes bacterium]
MSVQTIYLFHVRRILAYLTCVGMMLMVLMIPDANAAEGTRVFSLSEAQKYAIANNYETLKSEMELDVTKKRIRETIGAGLPQISTALAYTNNLELVTMLIPDFFGDPNEKIEIQFGTQHNANLNLQIQQLVFNGSYFVGLATSRIFKRLATEGLERTKLEVMETVSQTYYLILVSQESERIIKGNLQNLEKTLFEILELYKEGFVEETDADVIQISVTALKNSLQNLQKQTKTAYQLLKFQMGIDLNEEIELTDGLDDIISEQDINKALSGSFDIQENIDYRLIQTQEKLAEMNLKNEKAQYWPTVAAYYSLSYQAQRNQFNFLNFDEKWYRSQAIGVNLNIPVFKSGAQKARVQQASIALDQARQTTLQVSQGLLLEEAQAKNSLSSAYENYINVKDNMELSKKVYDKTLIKYQEGLASSTDLTQANDRYLAAQGSYIQALSELLGAKNALDRLHNDYQVSVEG